MEFYIFGVPLVRGRAHRTSGPLLVSTNKKNFKGMPPWLVSVDGVRASRVFRFDVSLVGAKPAETSFDTQISSCVHAAARRGNVSHVLGPD